MTQSWRLLGPLEAANGALMFGVSTAMIFALIQRLILARFMDLGREGELTATKVGGVQEVFIAHP